MTLNSRIDGLETTLNCRIDGLETKIKAELGIQFGGLGSKIYALLKNMNLKARAQRDSRSAAGRLPRFRVRGHRRE